jgi:tetratricopeptide (TPR) repeat protein
MRKISRYSIISIFVIVILLSIIKYVMPKNLNSLSPKQALNLYYKAKYKGNVELIKKLIYFPPGTSEAEIKEKIGPSPLSTDAKGARHIMKMTQTRAAVEYEKILSEDTAEVGIVAKIGIGPLSKRTSVDQIILKRDSGIWKIHYSRGELTKEQIENVIRESPKTAWAYYYFGTKTQAENPYKACRYYQKCYELEPKGFWADLCLAIIGVYEDTQEMERIILGNIQNTPRNSDGRAVDYIRLSQLCVANNNIEKARKYLNKSEEILKANSCRDKFIIDKYKNVRQELEAVESGEYTDVLMELEAEGAFD